MPVVVLTPLLLHALDQASDTCDADINIETTSESINIHVAQHKTGVIKKTVSLSRETVAAIKNKTMAWKPENTSPQEDFNAVYKYVSQQN